MLEPANIFAVARRLHATEILRDEPSTLVALTGHGLQNDKQRTEAAGCDHFLVKPVDLGALQRLFEATQAKYKF